MTLHRVSETGTAVRAVGAVRAGGNALEGKSEERVGDVFLVLLAVDLGVVVHPAAGAHEGAGTHARTSVWMGQTDGMTQFMGQMGEIDPAPGVAVAGDDFRVGGTQAPGAAAAPHGLGREVIDEEYLDRIFHVDLCLQRRRLGFVKNPVGGIPDGHPVVDRNHDIGFLPLFDHLRHAEIQPRAGVAEG
ncbi:hypothetical protein DESC_500050 [Desulfosarcina cetonica]|nr:hypothetical protein DESC_500050 [Desulfosarcina cetonica]